MELSGYLKLLDRQGWKIPLGTVCKTSRQPDWWLGSRYICSHQPFLRHRRAVQWPQCAIDRSDKTLHWPTEIAAKASSNFLAWPPGAEQDPALSRPQDIRKERPQRLDGIDRKVVASLPTWPF